MIKVNDTCQMPPLAICNDKGGYIDRLNEGYTTKTYKSHSQKGHLMADTQILQSEKYEVKSFSKEQAMKNPKLILSV
jgi:hypothetical protein